MRAQLVPLEGGEPLEITKDMTLIGRSESCDLRLDHKSISKMHCVIVKTDGLLLLRDLGSTNGTRVNDTRVRRAALLPNDNLTVASLKYRVLFGAKLEEAEKAVQHDEHTQQMKADDVKQLLQKKNGHAVDEDEDAGSSEELPAAVVQANQLPDVYIEPKKK